MSKITLTDRISVSVRAKNDTESSQQKVDTGKNIAKTLGVDDYNDTDAATIGNTSKPTITDENGNEWVSMQDIIDAGKKMQQDGAFDGPEYDDYVHNGYHYLRTNTVTCIGHNQHSQVLINGKYETHDFVEVNVFSASGGMFSTMSRTQSGGNTGMAFGTMVTVDPNAVIHYKKYRQCTDIDYIQELSDYDMNSSDYTPKNGVMAHTSLTPDAAGLQKGVLDRNVVNAMLNGNPTITHHGGSLIDWTKPDDEIEEDIRQLHETWDVSEHEGAVTANGTYVLAGPIEYNPGD